MERSSIVMNQSQFDAFKHCNFKKGSSTRNNALFFINYLIFQGGKSEAFSDYLQIPANWFKTVFSSNYHRFLKPLISSGLIERDGIYWKGNQDKNGKCYGYRIAPELLSDDRLKIIPYKIHKSKKIQSKDELSTYTRTQLRNYKTLIKKRDIENGFFADYVTEELTRAKLKVDFEINEPAVLIDGKMQKTTSVIAYANAQNKSLIKDGKKFRIDFLDEYLTRKRTNLILSYATAFWNFKEGFVFAQMDSTSGRIHSNVTNLPGETKVVKDDGTVKIYPPLLSLFTFRNQKIVSIDVKTSQPHLIGEILNQTHKHIEKIELCSRSSKPHLHEPRKKEGKLETMMTNTEKEIIVNNHLTYMFFSNSQKPFILNGFKVRKMLIPTKINDFYENLTYLLKKGNPNKNYTRSDGKKLTFEILFSSFDNNTPEKFILKRYAPDFVKWIDGFKKGMIEYYQRMEKYEPEEFNKIVDARKNNRLKKKKTTTAKNLGNSAFSVMLQRIEADIMKEAMKAMKEAGLNVLSKHDSFICPINELEKVESIMKETFLKYYETAPVLKREYY